MPDRYVTVVTVDEPVIFVAVSDAYAELVGYRPDELAGTPTAELVVEYDAIVESSGRKLHADGYHVGVVTLRHRDGRLVRFAYRSRLVVNGHGDLNVTTGEPIDDDELEHAAPVLFTKSEAAALARVHVRTLERAVAAGELHLVSVRGRRFVDVHELERWLGVHLG